MRYTWTCKFVVTEEEAKAFCDDWDASLNRYARKKYPSHYTPWKSKDGTFCGFVCWTVW